ncbi:hypothetical protein EVG20_g10542 [Dentipellis fragilis]|uniref:BTB domain-containing protein n=1 Tax=Dentipellis fragilis TaxID=205917 RepID=A0A4Y9XST7_9AGAM|nr:hypothetical protein EVG20_g10542 [Dentipellis fragilis]
MADTTVPQTLSAEDPQPRSADAPFDNQDNGADIILRSSDKVDFYAHKIFLSFASPVFKTMFNHIQFTDPACQPTTLDVSEDSRTLEFILRSCYPVNSTPLTKLADVRRVMEAVFKYDVDSVLREAALSLKAVVDQDPLGILSSRGDVTARTYAVQLPPAFSSARCSHSNPTSFATYQDTITTSSSNGMLAAALPHLARHRGGNGFAVARF